MKIRAKYGKWILGLLLLSGIGLLVLSIGSLAKSLATPDQPFIYYTVVRSDLPIVVTERGSLESQQETTIRCQVESRGYDRSGTNGTQIIFIVPNGSSVQEGNLLVELDSAPIREELDNQIITYEHAQASQIQAQAQYDNQITQNKTAEENAILQVKLAELELQMFTDEESGTHKLEVEEINRSIEDTNNDILASQATLELQRNNMVGIESLFNLGYAGKSERDKIRLDCLQAESQLASRINRLTTQLATLEKKRTYEREMQLLKLQGDLDTAKRNQEKVDVDNKSAMAQVKASRDAATRALDKEAERLEKLKVQLANCKIVAPHDGMVVYQTEWGRDPIAEGTFVRERQPILALPNLSKMQVETFVHESVLDQVQPGQLATARIDAFPDRLYRGVIESVGVVPADRGRFSRDVKTYETIVRIEEKVEQLKPGMTAVVEIHVDRIKDVLAVPIQAIVQVNRDIWCYIEGDGGVEQRLLSIGRTNDKFVHILDGLAEGDRVVLNPMLILESQQETEKIGPDAQEPEPLEGETESLASAREDEPLAVSDPTSQLRPSSPDPNRQLGSVESTSSISPNPGALGNPARRQPDQSNRPPPQSPTRSGEPPRSDPRSR
ncbi:MAG: efflux RND transporter periplasmic adaptor subunit [Pirellulales bacterium]|nr:efflux RND transporter periplasmic adaptor subunit [Pirellulales bacterium]